MKYEVRLPAQQGDIVPLVMVADAKARFRATAGGTDFHKPAYDGSFERFADDLLREAQCGRLKVCNQFGIPGEADVLIAEATQKGDLTVVSRYLVEPDWERLHRENEPVAPGVWHLAHLDRGPSEVDWTRTHLSALATTLKWLNEWGESRGDLFTVTHEGVEWVDERGIQRPIRAAASSEPGREPRAPDSDVAEPVPTAADDAPPSLTTGNMAYCFAGLRRWDEPRWKKALGDKPKWLEDCIAIRGQQGVRERRWNPVCIGAALVNSGHALANSVRARFQSQPLLQPWLEAWKTYEADYLDSN